MYIYTMVRDLLKKKHIHRPEFIYILRGGPAKPGTFQELKDPGARGPRFAARAAPRDDIRDPPALQPRAGPVTGARTTKRTVQRLPP